jgi:hypothetical protein
MLKWFLLACIAAVTLSSPVFAETQQPPAVVIEKNASLDSRIRYQKWNVREVTDVFMEKDFNGPIIAILQPGDLVWGITGDIHAGAVGRILVTRDHQIPKSKRLMEGDIIYPLYSLGNGVYKFWHQGDILIDSLLDIKGLFPTGQARAPVENKVWGVSLWGMLPETSRQSGSEEWWVQIRLPDNRLGWTNRPYHFGNNGLAVYPGLTIVIDNRLVIFDPPPLLEKGTVWVPVVNLAEFLSGTIHWDEQRGMLTLSVANDKTLQLFKNSRTIVTNGTVSVMAAPTRVINNRFLVPVGPVAEALGWVVSWDGETRQILITAPGKTWELSPPELKI